MIHILILTHNRLEAVQRCFESLMPTLLRDDVNSWVLDNASTDGTAEYVKDITFNRILSDSNLGVALGRATLLKQIENSLKPDDFVVFLDSDTVIVDDNWLDVLAKALEPESVGVAGPFGSFVLPGWTGFTAGIPGLVDTVAGACQCWKGELFLQGLRPNTDMHGFWHEDAFMCLEARSMGYDVVCVPVGMQHFPAHSGFGQDMALHDKHFAMVRERWQGQGLVRCEGGY